MDVVLRNLDRSVQSSGTKRTLLGNGMVTVRLPSTSVSCRVRAHNEQRELSREVYVSSSCLFVTQELSVVYSSDLSESTGHGP